MFAVRVSLLPNTKKDFEFYVHIDYTFSILAFSMNALTKKASFEASFVCDKGGFTIFGGRCHSLLYLYYTTEQLTYSLKAFVILEKTKEPLPALFWGRKIQ